MCLSGLKLNPDSYKLPLRELFNIEYHKTFSDLPSTYSQAYRPKCISITIAFMSASGSSVVWALHRHRSGVGLLLLEDV